MLLIALLMGCPKDVNGQDTGTGPTDAFCGGEAPTIELGQGSSVWEEMPGDVTMVHGPQGGWHIETAVKIHNMNDIVTIDVVGYHDATDTEVCRGSYRVLSVETEECLDYYPGMYCYLETDPLHDEAAECDTPPEVLSGESVRIEITVVDQDDREAGDSRTPTAQPDASDSAECGPEPSDLEEEQPEPDTGSPEGGG